ncbi:hypothetical protein HELRODRAFT_184462 [Helobdella robusta]|uniref:ELM2 domain-containing protein n=1 Tax=Helobdella robusta TaxID=6412 RepID=T1FL91_HELRO|nr:hypothetical protein HELRODRAFT_184462 [Helobdella robusta]ESN95313.1 hypothetical protein HELRODRAFT_184462 [Helobdella robusta]
MLHADGNKLSQNYSVLHSLLMKQPVITPQLRVQPKQDEQLLLQQKTSSQHLQHQQQLIQQQQMQQQQQHQKQQIQSRLLQPTQQQRQHSPQQQQQQETTTKQRINDDGTAGQVIQQLHPDQEVKYFQEQYEQLFKAGKNIETTTFSLDSDCNNNNVAYQLQEMSFNSSQNSTDNDIISNNEINYESSNNPTKLVVDFTIPEDLQNISSHSLQMFATSLVPPSLPSTSFSSTFPSCDSNVCPPPLLDQLGNEIPDADRAVDDMYLIAANEFVKDAFISDAGSEVNAKNELVDNSGGCGSVNVLTAAAAAAAAAKKRHDELMFLKSCYHDEDDEDDDKNKYYVKSKFEEDVESRKRKLDKLCDEFENRTEPASLSMTHLLYELAVSHLTDGCEVPKEDNENIRPSTDLPYDDRHNHQEPHQTSSSSSATTSAASSSSATAQDDRQFRNPSCFKIKRSKRPGPLIMPPPQQLQQPADSQSSSHSKSAYSYNSSSGSASSNFAFQSRLRSPRILHGYGSMDSKVPPPFNIPFVPYTPPPMLSPTRNASGLFCLLNAALSQLTPRPRRFRALMNFASSAAVPFGGSNIELAHHILNLYNGDVKKTCLSLMERRPLLPSNKFLDTYKYSETSTWTTSEIEIFNRAVYKYYKDFFSVANEMGLVFPKRSHNTRSHKEPKVEENAVAANTATAAASTTAVAASTTATATTANRVECYSKSAIEIGVNDFSLKPEKTEERLKHRQEQQQQQQQQLQQQQHPQQHYKQEQHHQFPHHSPQQQHNRPLRYYDNKRQTDTPNYTDESQFLQQQQQQQQRQQPQIRPQLPRHHHQQQQQQQPQPPQQQPQLRQQRQQLPTLYEDYYVESPAAKQHLPKPHKRPGRTAKPGPKKKPKYPPILSPSIMNLDSSTVYPCKICKKYVAGVDLVVVVNLVLWGKMWFSGVVLGC